MDGNQYKIAELATQDITGVTHGHRSALNTAEVQKPENTHHEINYNLAYDKNGNSPKGRGNSRYNTCKDTSPDDD